MIARSTRSPGSYPDENGVLHTWWGQEDIDRFNVKAQALAAQYSAYEPLPGLHINGNFTFQVGQ